MENKIWAVLTALLLSSCSVTTRNPQQLEVDKLYKKDMLITYQGRTYEGVAVLPAKDTYKLHIRARGNLDMFTLATCHRDWTKEKAWNVHKEVGHWFWKRKIDKEKELRLTFTRNGIEKHRGQCIWDLGGYESNLGRHSWAMIDIQDSKTALRYYMNCNGEYTHTQGVGICQSREGLFQSVKFAEKVRVLPDSRCSIGSNEGTYFEFKIKKDRCVYRFRTVNSPKKEARLTTFGYNNILIRN